MARWGVVTNASKLAETVQLSSLVALLTTVLVFTVCVTTLLALCAARSRHMHDLNARREFSSGELAIAAPEEFEKQDLNSRPLSFRFSSGSSHSENLKLGAGAGSAINKLSSSFRISSFRISSFRVDSCKQMDGKVDPLRKVRLAGLEEEDNNEAAVWQKNILRGHRCVPLSFSGLVLYDVNGKRLPSFNEETKKLDLHKHQFGSTLPHLEASWR